MRSKFMLFRNMVSGVALLAFCQTGQASTLPDAAVVTAAAAPQQMVEFEVFLPLRNRAGLEKLIADQQNEASPSYHQWLTPSQFSAQFGPTAESVQRVQAALKAGGLQVGAVHSRSLAVRGSVAQIEHLFSTRLNTIKRPGAARRLVVAGGLAMPDALATEGAVVVHFAGVPAAHSLARNLGPVDPANRRGQWGGYYYNDLKQAYDYPSYQTLVKGQNLDGTGAKVAILMSNDVLDSDIKLMFDHEHFSQTTGKPDPTLAGRLLVNGGAPFDPDASFESSLDVQQVLGGAPGAAVTLVNLPDLSDENILAGYLQIVESNEFDLVNSSFGGCEKGYAPAYNGGVDYYGILDVYDTLFAQGNSQGITFVASSGDEGGLACPDISYFSGDPNATPKFVAGVSEPASSPHVTAVGGTNLSTTTPPSPQTTPPTLTSKYVRENADGDPEIPYDPYNIGINVSGGYWGAGGGISDHFASPAYQLLVLTATALQKRTVPDVGMQVGGCPGGISVTPCSPDRSFVIIWDGGRPAGVIGTSVSSPEFVGALALRVQKTGGRLGNVNYYLYDRALLQDLVGAGFAPPAFQYYHRNIPGFDGLYHTDYLIRDYNFITGNGTPDVRKLLDLGNLAAGDPQTSANP